MIIVFFEKRNVLVTGGAGFIGSALVRELLKEKANVVVLDNFLSGRRENLKEVLSQIKLVEGDIRDKNLEKFLKKEKIEFVFNLAALPFIPDCYDRPTEFFEVNAGGALNVMMASKKAGVERIIQYSTSEVYGTAKQIPMDEHHPTLPLSTYSVAKLAADRLCYTLHHEQEVPVVIFRQFNTFGPRETHKYIIPELISQLSNSNKLKLGNVNARRDFTFVEDSARAAIELMKHEEAVGNVYNCGFGQSWSVRELAELIAELMGVKNLEIEIETSRLRPLDVEVLQANYFKLHKLTGWHPKTKLEEGLQNTIDWFEENSKKWPWEG